MIVRLYASQRTSPSEDPLSAFSMIMCISSVISGKTTTSSTRSSITGLETISSCFRSLCSISFSHSSRFSASTFERIVSSALKRSRSRSFALYRDLMSEMKRPSYCGDCARASSRVLILITGLTGVRVSDAEQVFSNDLESLSNSMTDFLNSFSTDWASVVSIFSIKMPELREPKKFTMMS